MHAGCVGVVPGPAAHRDLAREVAGRGDVGPKVGIHLAHLAKRVRAMFAMVPETVDAPGAIDATAVKGDNPEVIAARDKRLEDLFGWQPDLRGGADQHGQTDVDDRGVVRGRPCHHR